MNPGYRFRGALKGVLYVMGTAAALVSSANLMGQTNSDPLGTPVDSKRSTESKDSPSSAEESEADSKNWIRDPLPANDTEWRRVLTRQQFNVLRQRGTEKAFSGKYWKTKTPGVYRCAGCGQPLFSSATKFDSGTGWPSYWAPYQSENISTELEPGLFQTRIEVHCSRCGGHLGHVFNDGPQPTGLRYCINSACLVLDPKLPLKAEPTQKPSSPED